MIDAFLRLMETPSDVAGPINLGNPQEITMLDLAKTITDLTGSRSEIVHHELPADDPARRCPDITKARETLNWEPKTSLESGLK